MTTVKSFDIWYDKIRYFNSS